MKFKLFFFICIITFICTVANGQQPINNTVNGEEYVSFGKYGSPMSGGTYIIDINNELQKFELLSRIQLNKRKFRYQSVEARDMGLFWLLFEFRNVESICFILCKRYNEEGKKARFTLTDKILTPNLNNIDSFGVFNACEYNERTDDLIFGIYSYEGTREEIQYFTNIKKAFQANTESGFISEVDEKSVRCYNRAYWDYMHDDETIPKWYHRGFSGEINDPDGYTNVRRRPNIKSEIVHKFYQGEEFVFFEDNKYDWWMVYYMSNEYNKLVQGFIHKSRVNKK